MPDRSPTGILMTLQRTARLPLLAVCVAVLCACASAPQHGAHDSHASHDPAARHGQHAPYAGLQKRDIKALSEQQISDLRAGRGMSLALPAELNGYPGPAHALELAEPLRLSPEQRSKTRQLFDTMQQEAKALGEETIAAERELDRLFRDRRVAPESLAAATAKAAAAQGRLRESHLRYHLAMMEVLTPEQVARYNRLRGY
jgi:Spy/CpxP family protein refolding chaperone